MDIIGDTDINTVYCTGSLTKLLTTYVSLSFLSEKYLLQELADDTGFLDKICIKPQAKEFLLLFQNIMGSQFTIRDLCSYYSGLPYTFDLSQAELESVESGNPFKHHSIPDEKTFLYMCRHKITPVYPDRCKFHYSEVGILFLGYFIEKNFDVRMEDLYKKYIIDAFQLKSSRFSRKRTANVYCRDISDQYDYPSIAILDHGYFCYSNGYYTTLADMKTLLENLINQSVFKYMADIKNARAASGRLLNGLALEIRLVEDDIIYGYEGLSFSGCNIWAYSTKKQQGFLTFCDSEEEAYNIIYDQWGYTHFDKVPDYAQRFYAEFLKNYHFDRENKKIPLAYQGDYRRVNINEKSLDTLFSVGKDFIFIRNPDMIKYDVVYANNHYCIQCKDDIHGGKVDFYEAAGGNKYMLYDGTLYKKLAPLHG